MKQMRQILFSSAACAAMCVTASAAWAQADDEVEVDDTATMGTVFVTAQKREQSIQDVPIAITAFDEEAIEDAGATSVEALASFIPGVDLLDTRGAGSPTWIIRGVGLEDFNSNNTPTAAIYNDEVYLTSNVLASIPLFDISQVEVLKGPQGGLYGRNTSGGAVRILSTRPDMDTFGGYGQISYGRWDRVRAEGALNIPLAEDKLAARISVFSDTGGGWQDTLVTAQDDEWGDRDFLAVRGQLLFTPTDDLEILLKFDTGQDKSETQLASAVGAYAPGGFGALCDPILAGRQDNSSCVSLSNIIGDLTGGLDPNDPSGLTPGDQSNDGRVVISNPINALDNEWDGLTLNIKKDLGFAELVSISNYTEFSSNQIFDGDATPLTIVQGAPGFPTGASEFEQWSQEVRLVSQGDGPLTWLVGGMYAYDENTQDQNFFTTDAQNLFSGVTRAGSDLTQETTSWALYGQAGYDVSETVNINGSIRYTSEEKDIAYLSVFDFFGFPAQLIPFSTLFDPMTGAIPIDGNVLNLSTELDTPWAGHIGVDWKPASNVLLYAKYSRGIKSGGFFGAAASDAAEVQPYGQETNDSFEVGLKSNPTEDFQFNATAFFYDYQDAQAFGQTPSQTNPDALTDVLTNVGDAEHTGIEIETLWTPSQLPGFGLQVSGAWLDAEITSSDTITNGTPPALGGTPIAATFEGLRRPRTPEYSYTVNAFYETNVTDSLLGRVSGVYSWRDDLMPRDAWLTIQDFGLRGMEAYGVLNLRASLADIDRGWELSLLGENVTDEVYVTNAIQDGGGNAASIFGLPARWSVQLKYEF